MNYIKTLITMALKEDIGKGDVTTNLLIPSGHRSAASVIAKEPGIICGLPLLSAIYNKVNRNIRVVFKTKDGARVRPGQVVAIIKGQTRAILAAERTALNFLQRLSGIATFTSQFVSRIKGTGVKILDTRKTAPGWRALDKYAVKTGAGFNHRIGLYDAFLVKNNHLTVLGGVYKLTPDHLWRMWLKKLPVEIEVANLNQFVLILTLLKQVPIPKASPKAMSRLRRMVIMLDNMTPEQIKEAVAIRNKTGRQADRQTGGQILLEASGGINLGNVRRYALTGVDYISIGALTHSPKALDISLRII
ncbi:MAG: carboxylating nicotinate-nucleotide diphosphorylase [Planctomycetota bacterium]